MFMVKMAELITLYYELSADSEYSDFSKLHYLLYATKNKIKKLTFRTGIRVMNVVNNLLSKDIIILHSDYIDIDVFQLALLVLHKLAVLKRG